MSKGAAIANAGKIGLKKGILEAGMKQHQAVIEDFRKRIKDMTANEGNVNEEEYDSHQQSFKAETTAEVSLLADQLQVANHELEELMRIQSYTDEIHDCVEYGTVVRTDKETFFVSAGIERFYVDQLPVFGLSVRSPIYKVMKGKKVGDSFSHAGIAYRIEEIF